MAKRSIVLTPKVKRTLQTVGGQIKLARLRRKLSAEIVAERACISRATLWSVENGSPTVAFGTYVSVLYALGLGSDVLLLAKDDVLGKTFQDLELLPKKRAPKQKNSTTFDYNSSV